jgi:hypothetical protein
MLSIVLPSKRLAELPGEVSGEASVMVFFQMANPEKRLPSQLEAGSIDVLILRSRRCEHNDRFPTHCV